MKMKILVLIAFNVSLLLFSSTSVMAKDYSITSKDEIIGSSAPIWDTFNNGDTIDISEIQGNELGRIILPEDINSLTIKGSVDKTYTKFNLTSQNAVSINLENVKCSSSTGPSAFYLPENLQSTIAVTGTNVFIAADNSKCIIGNVTFNGSGSLTIQSGTSISESNISHGILGNVIFDHTGMIRIISSNGKAGTSSSYDGISAGDAIHGNVECKNTGSIVLEAGNGGRCLL